MKQVVNTENIPIKLWLDEIDPAALSQARNLANLPFAFRHIPIMPDSHVGFGMPIGSILATKKVVVPNAVGVDIGCGMCAIKTSVQEIETKQLKETLSKARELIPMGFKWQSVDQEESLMPEGQEDLKIVSREYKKAIRQLGTLGGGNHFIEIQKGSDGFVWIMIHSGSRNIGKNVADYYNRAAVKLNERYFSLVEQKQQLAFLPIETIEAKEYIKEMNYCVEFALANRKLMMKRMLEAMEEVIGEFDTGDLINKSHNFAAWENHFNTNVLVHRKGATRAYPDELGMIPGSQGTSSYIVIGKGNPESFKSCSHGAGRKLGRHQARKELSLEDEVEKLNDKGVVHAIHSITDLDEAPGSYKDIDMVMENQSDLVDILVKLEPLAVLKG